jgi:ABC-type transport system involved in cytochrome c biogenesis permease subunit
VIAALVIEWINKRRIGIAAAVMLGALGLFLAGKFEEIDGSDTMPQLLAVLDTNFWLATHVTCITIGYAAGLLAAAIAHVYVIGKAFQLKKSDPEFYRAVGRMVYGALAFSLIFSVVGTILGGVWANDSWGRFWGWDPKENGALMIVLSQLAMIHARMGGYIKTFGFAMATILGAIVIGFSWWGVNLMGVGLHAYGFTAGLQEALNIFYMVEGGVFVFAGSVWVYETYFATPRAST